jgi:hypothetical protein
MSLKDVGQRVHELTQAYCEVTGNEYWDCMRLVLKNHPELAVKYLSVSETRSIHGPSISPKRQGGRPHPGAAGQKLDQLTRQYMYEHNIRDYTVALRAVLRENKELVRAYVQV